MFIFFFKQKTAYEMRISDWSSDVCSSDLANYLAEIWAAIEKAAGERKGPFLVYQENNIILRALRDYLRADIGEVVIDNAEVYEQARTHMEHVNPQNHARLKLYKDDITLFSRYQIDSQIEQIGRATCRERVCQYG